MLHASRAEARSIRRTGRGIEDDSDGGDTERQRARNVLWRIYGFLDEYIFEVIATGFRFVHLVVLFIPVIASVPIVFLGRRVKDRDNHRRGALLWYALVVYTMERAGSAFIKVEPNPIHINNHCCSDGRLTVASIENAAWAMGCFKVRYLPT